MDISSCPTPPPIDSLPEEVIEKILLLVVRSSPDTREVLTTLPLVCKTWASLLDLQVFRSYLALDFKDRVSSSAGNGEVALRNLLRTIDKFFFDKQSDGTSPCTLVLKTGYSHDLDQLRYCDNNPNPIEFIDTFGIDGQLSGFTACKISEADICVDPVSTWGARMPRVLADYVTKHGKIAAQMPELTNFQLTAHYITPWMKCIPWSQLKALTLRIEAADIEDIFEVFHQCRENLEEVYLQAKAGQRDIDRESFASSRSRFRVLKSFKLVVDIDDAHQPRGNVLDYLFNSVEFPEVRSVSVQLRGRIPPASVNRSSASSSTSARSSRTCASSILNSSANHPSTQCWTRENSGTTSWEEKYGKIPEYDMRAHERQVFMSLFGNLPEGLKSLILVADVQEGLRPVEVFGMYDLLSQGQAATGAAGLGRFSLSGPAAAQCERFINQDLPERDLRLSVGIWDNDAAFEEFREDFPDEEEEDDYMDMYD
ncbi:hypothetical protein FA13DRAFT_1815887 [Coprinellus micaceus]|uniref:Uncharacterized protein n=1 Tax=Coprinellus micaceus TaxID=71717 RepID=A0A4Y7T431_COPMI|nr:hypothetical protein FA13DRAFT_1815887 [Coprinellus micaceus]